MPVREDSVRPWGRARKAVAITVLSIVVSGTSAFFYLQWVAGTPVRFVSATMILKPGSSLRSFAELVTQLSDFKSPVPIIIWVTLTGRSTALKAGEYSFRDSTTLEQVLSTVVRGEVVKYTVTFPEGFTFRDFNTRLAQAPALDRRVMNMTQDVIVTELAINRENPEGLFFPDTYHYTRGATPVSILRTAHFKMKERLNDVWTKRLEGLPLTNAYEALILASIIEKESAEDGEKPRIGGVLINRLRQGMRLQVDPTVIYGLGSKYHGNLTKKHLAQDTPYNTYRKKGLPPTPISSPGWQSLLAAVRPEQHEYYYFVAKGDGTHHFSRTLKEHHKAVDIYQKSKL